ncbi:MAG: efflux RND transporter permease subunit [Gammaproteobacteria bacterium]|nr:efflux RND transporter permease subunit [Gammaproteobacteria bacterium]
MNITQFAIERNRIALTLLFVVLISGAVTYTRMPRAEDPGFTIRTAQVRTIFPGASPKRVEDLVTDKLEKAIQEIPELDFITSRSKTGISVIMVNLRNEYMDIQPIWDKLRRKVDDARDQLPADVLGPYVDDEFGDVFGTIVSITGDGFDYRELKTIADDVRDELLLITQVAKVEIYGDQDERIFAEFNNSRLAELGLSPMQLKQILESRNIILPGGNFSTPYERLFLEPSGSFESLSELGRSIINLPGTTDLVRLEDLVSIHRAYVDPPQSMMRSAGDSSLGLAISMREGGNILQLGQAVKDVIRRANSVYPIGIEFDFIQFQAGAVERKIDDFANNLLQAIIVVAMVMLLFLGLRTGLIVATLIPSAMFAAIFFMGLLDVGLHQMSLAGLIISLGMLVDNAIVMAETIMVQMTDGKPAKRAAIDSAVELRIPLLVSSLTTAAAFLPIRLAESNAGEYTAALFTVVTVTLLCSWVIALTIIPMLCVAFMKVKLSKEQYTSRFYAIYRAIVVNALKRRGLILLAAGAVFFLALQGFRFIPNIFFPPNDRPTLAIEIELPVGSPIEPTNEIVIALEQFMFDNLMADQNGGSGIINWGAFIGEGAPRYILSYRPEPPTPEYAYVIVNASSRDILETQLIPPIREFLENNFPGLKPSVRPLPLGPPAWPPVEIRISGRDSDQLFVIADKVRQQLAKIPGTKQISDDWGAKIKKIAVEIDETRARLAGVSHQDIAISLQAFLSGIEVAEYREDDKLIPVVLRSRTSQNLELDAARFINVFSQATGRSVPLSQVAEAKMKWEPGIIRRRDRLRTVTVSSLLEPGYTAAGINQALRPWLEDESANWGFGFGWEFGGVMEKSIESSQSINEKLPIAGLIILILLVAQFNSMRRPAIILLTIPLSIIGVVIGLLVARSYFGFITLLGVISLAGIVINNAIVLIDRISREEAEPGTTPQDAIVNAAQRRIRPILLTTTTTVAGMIPLWLGGGPMWEPLAITIIFGLIFATMLTLIVVPVLYSLLFKVDFANYA